MRFSECVIGKRVCQLMKKNEYKKEKISLISGIWNLLKSIAMMVLATLVGGIFVKLGLSEANITMVYILAVLIISVITTHQIYSLVFSFVSVVVFNFFFTIPRFTLRAYDKDYPITFVIMFLAAFLTGSLAARLKAQVHQSEMAAYRTKILLETNQMLGQAKEQAEIISITEEQVKKLLNREAKIFPKTDYSIMPKDKQTDMWFTIAVSGQDYGCVRVSSEEKRLDAFEENILRSVLGECALALENEKNAKEKAEAALLAQKEQLRANLLRSLSHDLRTPLTSISGNASNLLLDAERFDVATRKQLYSDIYDDAVWLTNLVENLLSVSKLEEGKLNLHFTTELLDEVITEAMCHIDRNKEEHEIEVRTSEEFLLVKVDVRLITQVIINIVDNAIKYTQKGSKIIITSEKEEKHVVVKIADNGAGIAEKEKEQIFEMFHTGAKTLVDSRRSLGLGLALCKSIIHTHGGEIWVEDNVPHGAVFIFTLPREEVRLHE